MEWCPPRCCWLPPVNETSPANNRHKIHNRVRLDPTPHAPHHTLHTLRTTHYAPHHTLHTLHTAYTTHNTLHTTLLTALSEPPSLVGSGVVGVVVWWSAMLSQPVLPGEVGKVAWLCSGGGCGSNGIVVVCVVAVEAIVVAVEAIVVAVEAIVVV